MIIVVVVIIMIIIITRIYEVLVFVRPTPANPLSRVRRPPRFRRSGKGAEGAEATGGGREGALRSSLRVCRVGGRRGHESGSRPALWRGRESSGGKRTVCGGQTAGYQACGMDRSVRRSPLWRICTVTIIMSTTKESWARGVFRTCAHRLESPSRHGIAFV